MDSKTLKPWQAKAICDGLFPGVNYLVCLRHRMEETCFPLTMTSTGMSARPTMPLTALGIKTHYSSCSGTAAPASFWEVNASRSQAFPGTALC